MKDDRKPTMADLQAIIDASEWLRDLINRLEDAYIRKQDWKETMALLDKLFYNAKESAEKESVH